MKWISAYRALPLVCLVAGAARSQDSAAVASPTVRTRAGAVVTLGGLLQSDARLILEDGGSSGPIIRRAELIVEATTARGFSVRVQPDFGQGRVLVQDAFVRWVFSSGADSLAVRTGRFRPAFGAERVRSSATLVFPERGLVNSYMPSRAMGADARVVRGRAAVQVGVFQPPVSETGHVVDTDGDLERAPPPRQEGLIRLEWRLRRLADGGVVRVHAGALIGRANGRGQSATQPSRILTIGQQPVFEFRSTGVDSVVADGDRWRGDLAIQSVGSRVAWHLEALEVEDGIRRRDIAHEAVKHVALGAAVSIVYGGRRSPAYVITPTAGHGAVEWGVRFGAVRVERNAVTRFAEPGSAAGAISVGTVVSWLPSASTRLALSYDRTRLDRAARRTEQAIILRVQQSF